MIYLPMEYYENIIEKQNDKVLLSQYINTISRKVLFIAIDNLPIDKRDIVIKILSKNVDIISDTKFNLLHYAALYGNILLATEILVQHKHLVNFNTEPCLTPLHIAAESGDIKIVKLLVENGADMNSVDMNNHSVFHSAAKGLIDGNKKCLDVTDYLLSYIDIANPFIYNIYGRLPRDILECNGCYLQEYDDLMDKYGYYID